MSPFDQWPDAHPAMLSAQQRVRRKARIRLLRVTVCTCLFWGGIALMTIAIVDWANGP